MPAGYEGGVCQLMQAPLVHWDGGQAKSACKSALTSALPRKPCRPGSVGQENLTLWDEIYPHDGGQQNPIMNWHENVVHKTGGLWYSTQAAGQCHDGAPGNCSWRVVKPVKKISKTCSDLVVNGLVESRGAGCFGGCPQPRNESSLCYIQCYYQTVLGEGAATSSNATGAGTPKPGSTTRRAVLGRCWGGAGVVLG